MIELSTNGLEGSELEQAVDQDIAAFDQYFQRELKNSPLVKSEVAILKTYLHYKWQQGRVQPESPPTT